MSDLTILFIATATKPHFLFTGGQDLPLHNPQAVSAFNLLLKRRSLSGSLIGCITETQEMLEFCRKQNGTADVIPIQKVNEAYEILSSADVKYCFSIYMSCLKSQ